MVFDLPHDSSLGPALLGIARHYNSPSFIALDPISVPRSFLPQGQLMREKGLDYHPTNVEIAALVAAHLAWGRRDIILAKSWDLLQRMDLEPGRFLMEASALEWERLKGFVHRTFQDSDMLWMLGKWSAYLEEHGSLESMFAGPTVRDGLHRYASLMKEGLETGDRMHKHFASPAQGSACKRMNMLLRWMVRDDDQGVDMGLWKIHSMRDLHLPLDVHSTSTAMALGLLPAKATPNWKAVEMLGIEARQICPDDPALLDFALFGLGEEALRSGVPLSEFLRQCMKPDGKGFIPEQEGL
ncbi:MAG: TIGR02757 family protein [Sphingobacteriia bacterium]|nr:TIGR02757 family protein [Sphingobacteriia bacterium]